MGKTQFDRFDVEELPAELTHWRGAFDARFLRFTNLMGKPRTCTIDNVQWLKSSNKNESKRQLLVTLREFEKPWAINVTNSETIAVLYGNDDPRSWVGKRVTLYPTKTKFGRDIVDCIRVRDQVPAEAQQAQQTQQSSAPAGDGRLVMSDACNSYLLRMRDAQSLVQLDVVEEAITNDDTLSQDETGLLVRALSKRTHQLQNPAP